MQMKSQNNGVPGCAFGYMHIATASSKHQMRKLTMGRRGSRMDAPPDHGPGRELSRSLDSSRGQNCFQIDGRFPLLLNSFDSITVVYSLLQVATLGYVGIGFSPNGGMASSDMILAWVTADGAVVLHVRKMPSNGPQ